MNQFDTFLYGNGLTLAVLSIVKKKSKSSVSRFLDCRVFISEFASTASHSRIVRRFNDYFGKTEQALMNLEKTRRFLNTNLEEINELGFERWVSKNLFNSQPDAHKQEEFENIKVYAYLLYNYWYNLIDKHILKKDNIRKFLTYFGRELLTELKQTRHIYTTNFDDILDSELEPDHIHGKFALPLECIQDAIMLNYSADEFEYTYLFGTNGIEKNHRIQRFRNIRQNYYALDFFFDDSLKLGNLLIFGLAFGKAEMLSDDFLSRFPEHKKNKISISVDGHILSRLVNMHRNKQLNVITVSYYSDYDKRNYETLFCDTQLEKIIDYKHCQEIINWDAIYNE